MGFPGVSVGKESTCNVGDAHTQTHIDTHIHTYSHQRETLETRPEILVEELNLQKIYHFSYIKKVKLPFCVCVNDFVVIFQSLSCVQLIETPWTVACQAPLSMGAFE